MLDGHRLTVAAIHVGSDFPGTAAVTIHRFISDIEATRESALGVGEGGRGALLAARANRRAQLPVRRFALLELRRAAAEGGTREAQEEAEVPRAARLMFN